MIGCWSACATGKQAENTSVLDSDNWPAKQGLPLSALSFLFRSFVLRLFFFTFSFLFPFRSFYFLSFLVFVRRSVGKAGFRWSLLGPRCLHWIINTTD
jgi:hypothetical protein